MMKPDDNDQYDHGFNFPRPLFVMCGPGYLRVHDPDEMAEQLMHRDRWAEYKNLKVYLKIPFGSDLVEVWPVFEQEDAGDHEHRVVKFARMGDGEVIEGMELLVDWFTTDEIPEEHRGELG